MIPHRAIFSESPSLQVSESLGLLVSGWASESLQPDSKAHWPRRGRWPMIPQRAILIKAQGGGGRRLGDLETRRLGENCPVWNHRSSTPSGPLPKNGRLTDGRTDGRRDTPSYRDARTHLKTSNGRGRWWKIFPQIDSLDAQWKDKLNKPSLKFGAFSVVIWWPWFVSANSEDCQNLKLARYF